jgi:DNA-binding SARP family transcriptional activator
VDVWFNRQVGRLGFPPAEHAVGRALLVRDRLLDRLRSRWHTSVTVLVAPAGYGKSTLLTQAVAANAAEPVGIEHLVMCWPGMTAASALGEALCLGLGVLPAPGGRRGVDEWAGAVIETVWRLSPQQVVIVVDNVHEVAEGSEAARLLDAVVAGLPANGHLVFAGRRPPPVQLARLEVEGRVLSLDHTDLAFTDAEVGAFAELRGTPVAVVTDCDGWPALAELLATTGGRGAAAGPLSAVSAYIGQEVLSHLPTETRGAIAFLAYVGPFDSELVEAALGPDVDVAALVEGVPLVGRTGDGEWYLHEMWQALLERDTAATELTDARRRAGLALLERGRTGAGMQRLIDAEVWDDVMQAAVRALGVVDPPLPRDVVAEWLARLPAEHRERPGGRLMSALGASDGDPSAAIRRFEACRAAFREVGDTPGEIACLVQLGRVAWWFDDEDALADAVVRVFELEADGWEEVVPLARLGRALLYDMSNDSRAMLAELDLIAPERLPDGWVGIERWMRAFGLLDLGHAAQALKAAEAALSHAGSLHIPLTQTRMHALWYLGRATEVFDAAPDLERRIEDDGYQHHDVLMACNGAALHALVGRNERAARYLAGARGASVGLDEAPLVDTALAVAEASVALVEGDESAAAATLAAHVERTPLLEGVAAAPQRRHVALFYVLVASTRATWEGADLGPVWEHGRRLARAVVAIRDGHDLPVDAPALDDVGLVQAHLPPPWVAELALGAVAAGRDDGWRLLDTTWSHTKPIVADIAERDSHPLAKAAKDAIGHLPVRPGRRLSLRLLGTLELHDDDGPIQHPDWRRERVRMLLAYLVLRPTVSRTELAADMWPGLDTESQSRNLRVTLTYLLRMLEPDRDKRAPSYFVRQHGNNLTLHTDDRLAVDVWEFDAACARAEEDDRHGAPATALAHALDAVDLWRGEPVEVASEPWALPLVEERRLRFAALAVRAGELLLATGDKPRVLTLAEQALEVDPWLDTAHRLVVTAHHAAGNDLAAQMALRRYRAAIHDLGLDPDDATLMVERLLDNLPNVVHRPRVTAQRTSRAVPVAQNPSTAS